VTIAYWCVLAGALLPLLFTALAKFGGPGFGARANQAPREFQARLEGRRLRAHWAHLNSLEAFPPFAAAVLMAHQIGVESATINLLAVAWVLLRLAYGAAYMLDYGRLRSLLWIAAMTCWVLLFRFAAQN